MNIKLGDLCIIQAGGTPSRSKQEYWNNGEIPWVKIGDIESKYINKTSEFITVEGLKNSSAKKIERGSILYTIFATLGEVCITNIDVTTNQAIAGITLKDDKVYIDYLYYFLKSLKNHVNSIGRGVAQNNINLTLLRGFEVPIPDKSRQLIIAQSLSNIEKILNNKKQQLKEYDQLIKSRFVEMFGDPITNTKGLPTKDLKDVLILKAGDFTTASDISDIPTHTNIYPCYGGNGIRGYVEEYNQEGEYSLVGRQGALSGNVQYARGKFKNTEHALLVSPIIEVNSIWLNQLLLNLDLKRYQTGAAQPGLSVKNLQEIQIFMVPLNVQKVYALFVEQVDKLKFEVQKSLDKTQKLFDSLMQEYFG